MVAPSGTTALLNLSIFRVVMFSSLFKWFDCFKRKEQINTMGCLLGVSQNRYRRSCEGAGGAILPAGGDSVWALPRSKRLSSASPDDLGLGALGLRRPETLIPRRIPHTAWRQRGQP